MNTAFGLTVLLGALWSMVGAVVATARKRECPIWSFYTCGSFFAALLLTGCGFFHAGELLSCTLVSLGLLCTGALLNALGQALTMYNLRGGARSLLFAIPQMNFLVVLLFSLVFLGEKLTAWSVLGILLLSGAILGAGCAKKDHPDAALPNGKQLLLAVSAALIVGGGQCAFLLAGLRASGGLSAGTKSVVILLFSGLVYGAGIPGERSRIAPNLKSIAKYGCAWGFFAALSYYTLFCAIPAMEEQGHGGFVFSIACPAAIVFFWLFSIFRMKDRVSRKQAILMGTIILGIILLRL